MEARIDLYPTQTISGYSVRPGRALPYGATLVPGGVNFSIFSSVATACTLVLFEKDGGAPLAELPLPDAFRIGDVWSITVFGLDPEAFTYGFRIDGPNDRGAGHWCDRSQVLLDPRARAMTGRDCWGVEPNPDDPYPYRAFVAPEDFDWQGDQPPGYALEDLVIYEMHVRGFTRHPSSGVKHPGTYAGLVEKIPYLVELGVNCVELLPIFEFDEFELSRPNSQTGRLNMNYWGYSTVGFFAPKAGYAATGAAGMQCDELKTMVRALHAAGIEVVLDVVFNHTCEGDHRGPTISFRGLDNKTYYLLTPEGFYHNFSGCGNSMNCNHPVVRELVLECLRYWVAEYHIDGFRFDAAAILGRGAHGGPISNPPVLEEVATDPVLSKTKLIAEAWDAGGLYLLGQFPNYGRFAEWNGKFRDDVRDYLRGEPERAGLLATRLAGSPDLYEASGRGPRASVNFVTCHDGFTLRDLVSYNTKHNAENDEGNRDGIDDNRSWNCGVEGDTDDPEILALRARQCRNAMLALMVSRGIPMLLMGDEAGHTQRGNNNAYCHDSEAYWLNWSAMDKDMLAFARQAIALRRRHPVLRVPAHPRSDRPGALGFPEVSWHGWQPGQPDWSSRLLVGVFAGEFAGQADVVLFGWNSGWTAEDIELPAAPSGYAWFAEINVTAPTAAREPLGARFLIGPRSAIALALVPLDEGGRA
ncbi:glycogen debranching protein GlgX [uncultured Thiocystis sp.]|jgi:glycogen operon protein|uniref:glycogen debranching protein GlgX n=1 Tax=uncultured Thiocystis sp. TaxID=1202134 RepID=UPI0025E20A0E|nr:glycogen debranching protein GlgX [uncultured Thiocystis sp.]